MTAKKINITSPGTSFNPEVSDLSPGTEEYVKLWKNMAFHADMAILEARKRFERMAMGVPAYALHGKTNYSREKVMGKKGITDLWDTDYAEQAERRRRIVESRMWERKKETREGLLRTARELLPKWDWRIDEEGITSPTIQGVRDNRSLFLVQEDTYRWRVEMRIALKDRDLRFEWQKTPFSCIRSMVESLLQDLEAQRHFWGEA